VIGVKAVLTLDSVLCLSEVVIINYSEKTNIFLFLNFMQYS